MLHYQGLCSEIFFKMEPIRPQAGHYICCTRLCRGLPDGSCLVSFGHMGIPGAAGFRRDVGKSRARGWIGDADQVLARRALNLPAGVLGFAFQGLITVGTVEFEFVRAHGL